MPDKVLRLLFPFAFFSFFLSPMKTWKITYAIQDGEYAYRDFFVLRLEAAELNTMAAAAALADHWDMDAVKRERFVQELDADGFAFLPGQSHAVKDLAWEQLDPIRITISDGLIESITGIPEGVTVEIRDWDGAFEDENGEWVPAVSEWAGPL